MKMLKRIFMVTAFSFFTVNALVANDRLLGEYVNNPVAIQFCTAKGIDLASFLNLNGTDIASEENFNLAKKQFRALALASHPDKNPLDEKAAQVFRLVGAQWDHLGEERSALLKRQEEEARYQEQERRDRARREQQARQAEQAQREQEIRYKTEQERIYRAEQIVREKEALLAKIAKKEAAEEREAAVLRAAANRINAEVRTERPAPKPSLFRRARNYVETTINDTVKTAKQRIDEANPFTGPFDTGMPI